MSEPLSLLDRLRQAPPAAGFPKRRTADRAPASAAQRRLWFLAEADESTVPYHVPVAFHIDGPLDAEALERGVSRVVERHEALRTALVVDADGLRQEISEPSPIVVELRNAESVDDFIGAAHKDACKPVDLSRAPLLRVHLYALADGSHGLLFVFHHAVIDAWSLDIFFGDLNAACAEVALPAIPHQYGDYAQWQEGWLSGDEARRSRQYWTGALAKGYPPLSIHPRRNRAADGPRGGAIYRFGVPAAPVEEVSSQASATPFSVLLAAFQTLLHRYSLNDVVSTGVPVACRTTPESESILGYFANTVVIPTEFDKGTSLTDVVQSVGQRMREALSHQELPFDEVVSAVAPHRSADANPLFDSVFVMQNTRSATTLSLPGCRTEPVHVHNGTAKFDLTLSVVRDSDTYTCELEYATDTFDADWAEEFGLAFGELLRRAPISRSLPVGEAPLLSEETRAGILRDTAQGVEPYQIDWTLHGLVVEQAARTPDATAIVADGANITYAELDRRSGALAAVMAERGVGRESVVGVCMQRSVEQIVSLLAILKAGGAFVPLDPRLPRARLAGIADDASLALVVTDEQCLELLDGLAPLLVPDSEPVPEAVLTARTTGPSGLAYVYYTSGSTGKPKGVAIDHSCAGTRLEWLRRRYALGSGKAVLYKTPLIFDVAIWEIFLPLMTGATVVMADAEAESDIQHIAKLLREHPVMLAHFVPSMLEVYLDGTVSQEYPHLQWVTLSGEAASAALIERAVEHFGVPVHNQYGQTETSEVAVWEGDGDALPELSVIGTQVGAYRLYVMDESQKLVPHDVPGELCVAGLDGLARGYVGRPSLTAQSFVPHPYPARPGERLYRTGDLVRRRATGEIVYLGRGDHLVKIRGCRVETGEVESVLLDHPALTSCVVIARPGPGGDLCLVAYTVGREAGSAELADHAASRLPWYMVPSAFVHLGEMPRTASGKIDRNRLPEPRPSDFEEEKPWEEPETPLEAHLAAVWSEVLGIRRVGRRDGFYALGGNSLQTTRVLAALKASFEIRLSVRDFMHAPTVEGQARLVMAALEKKAAALLEENGA
ncbi:non-ribosomal peptide synthetase [Streptomyces sp. PTD5-9]|uniref:non-ribosomal peptide synthetase n=1 Tax=Streptomyces sp. PTD5-9 TaxID=3120150 RepID=UPI00300BDAAE